MHMQPIQNFDNKNRIEVSELVRDFVKVDRSGFPLDMVHTTTMSEGALVPLDCFPVMPTDKVYLENDVLVSVVNPFVDRMFSGMRLYVHYYYSKAEWLWKGWKNYATHGRRGNIKLSLPKLSNFYRLISKDDGSILGNGQSLNVQSLPAYLGVPLNAYWPNKAITASEKAKAMGIDSNTQLNRDYMLLSADGDPEFFPSDSSVQITDLDVSALPFAFYQSIFRNFYLNKNLVKDNTMWFPDDDDEFILPYAGGICRCLNEKRPSYGVACPVPQNFTTVPTADLPTEGSSLTDGPILSMLRYRQYDGDPNTMALPFLERGGLTSLFLEALTALKGNGTGDAHAVTSGTIFKPKIVAQSTNTGDIFNRSVPNTSGASADDVMLGGTLRKSLGSLDSYASIGVVLNNNELSELSVYGLWSRRNAYTDGDYNSLIKAHYGFDPNSEDRKPIYIGGSVQRLAFSEVLQTSASGDTPLGTQASRAYSAGHASIGTFDVPDFGFIMAVGSLVPDTFYTQGLPEYLDPAITGSELPFPEFNSLPPQPRLNKRISAYYGADVDDGLFGYNEPFLDWKVRMNRLSGAFLIPPSLESKFASMTFARYFSSRPALNNNFVTLAPWNVRFDMFSAPSEPHFIVQFGSKVSAIRPMPFYSKQATLASIA